MLCESQSTEELIESIRCFLDTWDFHLNESMHLYVKPRRTVVTTHELHGFLARLSLLIEDDFPDVVTFDFSATAMKGCHWRRLKANLESYSYILPVYMVVETRGLGNRVTWVCRSPHIGSSC